MEDEKREFSRRDGMTEKKKKDSVSGKNMVL